MVEEERYCVDALHQVAAAEGALDRVGQMVLGSRVETCVASALESGKLGERKEKLDEPMEISSGVGPVRRGRTRPYTSIR
jgi:DNA-binding FrmR family transcriptional regulator